MIILGLSTMGSSAASIFVDDRLIAAVEEERLTRLKNDGGFPLESIKECLRIANVSISQVDVICVYWKPYKIQTRLLKTLGKGLNSKSSFISLFKIVSRHFLKSNNNQNAFSPEENGKWGDLFKLKKIITSKIGPFNGQVKFFDHHLTHQLYGEIMKDWEDSILLSYDGGGEEFSTVLAVSQKGIIKPLKQIKWPNSLGHFYSFFTGYLGFKMQEGEYKMMGLAPYGQPVFKEKILEIILKLLPNGSYEFNYLMCDYHDALNGNFNIELERFFGKPRNRDEKPTQNHINLAASVQAAFEEAEKNLLGYAKLLYPNINKLVVSGGCALNVTANGKVLKMGLFEEIIVPPAPHDAGCSIGAILAYLNEYQREILFDKSSFRTPYLGAEFSNDEIEKCFMDLSLPIPKMFEEDILIEIVSNHLIEGDIICWFQGKAEFGPRALGTRSFLADPRNDDIREQINQKIKKRELFRPFAPSVIAEAGNLFFEIDQQSPYMNIVANVRDEKKVLIPAVTHVDGTARVHTVSFESNKLYHKLLSVFGEKTGVPVLLNTSFNIQEPIVYTPRQAISTFLKSDVDVLAIGGFVCDSKWREQIKSNIHEHINI